MAELKTKPTKKSVKEYIASISDTTQRADAEKLVEMMGAASGAQPTIWGDSIIGFGSTHLKYASGKELDWFPIGFAARKGKLSLYLTCDLDTFETLLKKLGPHKRGVGCLYIKKLEDVDEKVLLELIEAGLNN